MTNDITKLASYYTTYADKGAEAAAFEDDKFAHVVWKGKRHCFYMEKSSDKAVEKFAQKILAGLRSGRYIFPADGEVEQI